MTGTPLPARLLAVPAALDWLWPRGLLAAVGILLLAAALRRALHRTQRTRG